MATSVGQPRAGTAAATFATLQSIGDQAAEHLAEHAPGQVDSALHKLNPFITKVSAGHSSKKATPAALVVRESHLTPVPVTQCQSVVPIGISCPSHLHEHLLPPARRIAQAAAAVASTAQGTRRWQG